MPKTSKAGMWIVVLVIMVLLSNFVSAKAIVAVAKSPCSALDTSSRIYVFYDDGTYSDNTIPADLVANPTIDLTVFSGGTYIPPSGVNFQDIIGITTKCAPVMGNELFYMATSDGNYYAGVFDVGVSDVVSFSTGGNMGPVSNFPDKNVIGLVWDTRQGRPDTGTNLYGYYDTLLSGIAKYDTVETSTVTKTFSLSLRTGRTTDQVVGTVYIPPSSVDGPAGWANDGIFFIFFNDGTYSYASSTETDTHEFPTGVGVNDNPFITEAETCVDSILNLDETDVDCGGSCHSCPNGAICLVNSDCISFDCTGGFCVSEEVCTDSDGDGYSQEGDACGDVDCEDDTTGEVDCPLLPSGCNAATSTCAICINPGATEVCDDIDNDCDGFVDEDLIAPACDLYQGVCAGSTKTCGGISGWLDCTAVDYLAYNPDYEATETTCDGLNNDCDGLTDEDFPNKDQSCTVGIGVCEATGMYVCKADETDTECNVVPGTPTETPEVSCGNLIDEDCDGADLECPCEITSIEWITPDLVTDSFENYLVSDGTQVKLDAEGTDCDAKTVDVEIWEDDLVGDDLAILTPPLTGTFTGTTLSISWNALYKTFDELGDPTEIGSPEYYFKAVLDDGTEFKSTNKIKVTGNMPPEKPDPFLIEPVGKELYDDFAVIRWNPAVDPDNDPLEYKIEYSDDSGVTWNPEPITEHYGHDDTVEYNGNEESSLSFDFG